MNMEKIIRVDWTRAVLLLVGLFMVYQLRFVFLILFVSFVLSVILFPFVRNLHKIHLPAALAVIIPLSVLVGMVATIVFYVGPAIAEQIPQFLRAFPSYLNQLPFVNLVNFDLQSVFQTIFSRIGDVNQVVVNIGAALLKAVIGFITVLVVTIYWLGSYEESKETLLSYLPKNQVRRGRDIWERIEHKLGKWFVGQMFVSIAVGTLVWAAARLLGLPYAGVLALLSALLEIIPNVGPVLAAFPAVLIGASESIEKAVVVIITYILIQQFENHILTPQLMGRTVKLHPIVIISAILTGGILVGLVGALFAVPAALVVSSFVDSYRDKARI